MARRSWSDPREPQAALSRSKLNGVVSALRKMRDKQVAMAKQPFTHDELINLFVEPQHHTALRYVYDLIEPSGITSTLHVKASMPLHIEQHASGDCIMKFSWYGKHVGGFHVPCTAGSEEGYAVRPLFGVADERNITKYQQVEDDLLDIQCRFALCELVVRHLNAINVCKTLPQMRYVWPAITILLSRGGFKDDAAMLTEPSARAGDKVNVPPELAKYLKQTNDTVARALMLDDAPTPDEDALPMPYYLMDTFRTR